MLITLPCSTRFNSSSGNFKLQYKTHHHQETTKKKQKNFQRTKPLTNKNHSATFHTFPFLTSHTESGILKAFSHWMPWSNHDDVDQDAQLFQLLDSSPSELNYNRRHIISSTGDKQKPNHTLLLSVLSFRWGCITSAQRSTSTRFHTHSGAPPYSASGILSPSCSPMPQSNEDAHRLRLQFCRLPFHCPYLNPNYSRRHIIISWTEDKQMITDFTQTQTDKRCNRSQITKKYR